MTNSPCAFSHLCNYLLCSRNYWNKWNCQLSAHWDTGRWCKRLQQFLHLDNLEMRGYRAAPLSLNSTSFPRRNCTDSRTDKPRLCHNCHQRFGLQDSFDLKFPPIHKGYRCAIVSVYLVGSNKRCQLRKNNPMDKDHSHIEKWEVHQLDMYLL